MTSLKKAPKRNPARVPASRYAQAKALWKLAKIGAVEPPLNNEQIEILKGTAYYHHFKELGWIENPPY